MIKVALFALCAVALALAQNKITALPGYNGPQLSQYTGYITIDEATDKNYFYWFIESENDPANDPLVFWYQGGPGCSGLIGLFSELGPYRPDFNGGIEYNNLGWTQFANIVFLEQPVGVGFSYSSTESDYNTNDTQAALDNFVFLEKFLETFPQYGNSDVYLSGESYAGVYIPTVVDVILNNTDSQIYEQLVGFTIGNPVISCESADYNAIQMNLFYYHGLVSYVVYGAWSALGCNEDSNNDGCDGLLTDATNQIGVIFQQKRQDNEPSLDPDNLYQDFCLGNGTLDFASDQGYPNACSPVGDRFSAYLNRADVQKAIGVSQTQWNECGGSDLNYTPLGNSMIPLYRRFFNERPELNILIYSGDVDIYTVPFGYTQACLHELENDLLQTWQPWFVNEATAGYVEVFNGYTYATIKGAGHEAPQYQPLTAFNLYERYLSSKSLTGPQYTPKPRKAPMTQARMLKKLGIRV